MRAAFAEGKESRIYGVCSASEPRKACWNQVHNWIFPMQLKVHSTVLRFDGLAMGALAKDGNETAPKAKPKSGV